MESHSAHKPVSLHDLIICHDKTLFELLSVVGRVKHFDPCEALLQLQCVDPLCDNDCLMSVDTSLTRPMTFCLESLVKVFGELSLNNTIKAKIINVVDELDVIIYHKAIRAREDMLKQRLKPT